MTHHEYPIYECPHCLGAFHRLTGKAKFDVVANGEMFEVLPHVKEMMWETFSEEKYTQGANLCCPECGQQYPDIVTDKLIKSSVRKPVRANGYYI